MMALLVWARLFHFMWDDIIGQLRIISRQCRFEGYPIERYYFRFQSILNNSIFGDVMAFDYYF